MNQDAPGPAPENSAEPVDAHPASPAASIEPLPRTGTPEVDAVLDQVEQVAQRPVSEHVPVYEHAHQRLRQALDDRGDPEVPDGPDDPDDPEAG